jgi:hypothetical protein
MGEALQGLVGVTGGDGDEFESLVVREFGQTEADGVFIAEDKEAIVGSGCYESIQLLSGAVGEDNGLHGSLFFYGEYKDCSN